MSDWVFTLSKSRSRFPLDYILSTLDIDSLPRNGFPMLAHVGAKPGVCHTSWVIATVSRCLFNTMLATAGCRLLLKTVKVLGGCDCGGMVTLGVEAVLIRRVVDRSVLTADFDPGVGLITCESVVSKGPNSNPPRGVALFGLPGSRQQVWGCLWKRWSRAEWGRVRDIDQNDVETWRDKMTFEECADVHTRRPRQVLSHAHMCRWKMSCTVRDTTRTD